VAHQSLPWSAVEFFELMTEVDPAEFIFS